MIRMTAAMAAAMLAGSMSLGGLAVQAQTPSPAAGQQAGTGSPACAGAMHEMMTMMSDHMGGGMMSPGSSAMPGMMTSGPGMGPGMMDPASSPGVMPTMDDECLALMGQMMSMMRDHMGAGTMFPSPSAAPSPDAHDAHHPATTDPVEPSESAAASVRLAVTLTDTFQIVPEAMSVPVGVPVTFVVTNSGAIPHEFVVGDEATQKAHATTMQGMGAMSHDEADAIGVAPGQTKELTITFGEPGESLIGCHVPGHWEAGMRGRIQVLPA